MATWMIIALVYLGVGLVVVLIGFVTMLRSPRRTELTNPRVFLRTTGIGSLAFLLWPGMVALGIVWQFRAGRAWMINVFGPGQGRHR